MAKLRNSRVILVEGDNEVSLFSHLKKEGIIEAKKIAKKNLWDICIKSYSINIPPNSDVIVIFDTDVTTGVDRFIANVEFLAKQKRKVILLQQTKNFEDEIAHCCLLTKTALFKQFCNTPTAQKKDFKRDVNQCGNLLAKLNGLGWDVKKLFVKDLVPCLGKLNPYRSTFSGYF